MKTIAFGLITFLLIACSASSKINVNNYKTFDEAGGSLPRKEVKHGIPVYYDNLKFDYKRNGKDHLKIHFDEPVVISVADKAYPWGYYQFPLMGRMSDGSIIVQWHLGADNVNTYGKGEYQTARSTDDGKTFQIIQGFDKPYGGLIISNGDRIAEHNAKAIPLSDLKMPTPLGVTRDAYSQKPNITLFKTSDMPREVNGIWLNRVKKGKEQWELERADLVDPRSVRYSLSGLVPVVWRGQMQLGNDKNIYTVTYPGFRLGDDGKVIDKVGVDCYMSADNGKTWVFQGNIPYIPDLKMDEKGNDRTGYSEPGFEILKDGTFVSVLRTTDGLGQGPMYVSHSYNKGKIWTNPVAITPSGVLPKLLTLDNGVLVMTTGRPGVQVLFSRDNGKTWTEAFEMLNAPVTDLGQYSCGYTELLPLAEDKFVFVYSDFRIKNENGENRKGIVTRIVTVNTN